MIAGAVDGGHALLLTGMGIMLLKACPCCCMIAGKLGIQGAEQSVDPQTVWSLLVTQVCHPQGWLVQQFVHISWEVTPVAVKHAGSGLRTHLLALPDGLHVGFMCQQLPYRPGQLPPSCRLPLQHPPQHLSQPCWIMGGLAYSRRAWRANSVTMQHVDISVGSNTSEH